MFYFLQKHFLILTSDSTQVTPCTTKHITVLRHQLSATLFPVWRMLLMDKWQGRYYRILKIHIKYQTKILNYCICHMKHEFCSSASGMKLSLARFWIWRRIASSFYRRFYSASKVSKLWLIASKVYESDSFVKCSSVMYNITHERVIW